MKLLVLDLDNTLADTAGTVTKGQWLKVIAVLTNHNYDAVADALQENLLKASFTATLTNTTDDPDVIALANKTYDDFDVSPLTLHEGATEILDLPVKKVLVTRGAEHVQNAKIDHLGIREKFEEIVIVGTFDTKGAALDKILETYNLPPEQIMVVGDRLAEEIKEAHVRKMKTIFIQHYPQEADFTPTHTVSSLLEARNHLNGA